MTEKINKRKVDEGSSRVLLENVIQKGVNIAEKAALGTVSKIPFYDASDIPRFFHFLSGREYRMLEDADFTAGSPFYELGIVQEDKKLYFVFRRNKFGNVRPNPPGTVDVIVGDYIAPRTAKEISHKISSDPDLLMHHTMYLTFD